MPIYMDRHDVSEEVTAEAVAKLHQEDLKIQHKFNCRGLTYWFDDKRKTAFCLIEAPDEQSLINMHNSAHGVVPHRIIEVEPSIVESFLGRIEDPEKSKNVSLNIINEPAFRTIMMTGLEQLSYLDTEIQSLKKSINKINQSISTTIKSFKGRVVNQTSDYFLVSFESVSHAINCAVQVQTDFNQWKEQNKLDNIELKTGLSAGVPVTDKESVFEDTIQRAERLYYISRAKIVITNEVKELYQSENQNISFQPDIISPISPNDEDLLHNLMDYMESIWTKHSFHSNDLSKELNLSKSNLYRKMTSITGESPNAFIKEFRLNKALSYIRSKKGNISEIAYETGFGSPSYFTKCFQQKYGVSPTDYLHLLDI
ncbi:nickel-binding protein [Mariniphaga sediminis]|uniref:nickel-binding protein n=1 Tax=Mariniphaga sediminis TaxID=1628158 RepID=UPI0035642654